MANPPTRPDLTFYLDFDHDGQFDAGDDITAYVQAATWALGAKQAWQHVADEPELRLTLRNDDRRFSPEYAASPYYGKLRPGRPVTVWDNTADRALWTGRVRAFLPTPMRYAGPFRADVDATGPKWLLENIEIDIELLENVTSDEIILAVLQKAEFPPAFFRAWRLGVAGYSELGETTYLADTQLASSLETGLTTWPYAGDNFDRFTSAYGALAAAVNAERGRLFFDRDGTITFYNRAHFQLDTTVVATLDDTMASLNYAYGDDVLNDARVVARARALSAGNDETLWTLDEPLTLRPDESRDMRARYTVGEGQQVAGRNVQTPSTGAGTLASSGGNLALSDFVAEARSASFTLTNSGKKDCEVTSLVIKGQKVTSYNAAEMRHQDQESISEFGCVTDTIDEPLIADPTFAQALAEYEVSQRAEPRGRVVSVTLQNRDAINLYLQRTLDIGDRIAVEETQTGHSGEYFIVGIDTDWRDAGTRFDVTYYLEPAASYVAWSLGVAGRSELGITTFLGL